MNLSTLRSKQWGAWLLGSLVLGYLLAWGYTFRVDPEIRFFSAALAIKEKWLLEQRQSGEGVNVFSGGSTTGFQVDSECLKSEFGIVSLNAGVHAGMGLDGTVALATQWLTKGDRLILMTEPSILASGGGELTPLAAKMLVSNGGLKGGFLQSSVETRSRAGMLFQSRPGFDNTVIMLGKWLAGRKMYRYDIDEIRPGGLLTTTVRADLSGAGANLRKLELSPAARTFLKELKAWSDERGIELVYLMPVSYVQPSIMEQQRALNRQFAREVAELIPVWHDPFEGAASQIEFFSDTLQHMTREAARERTRAIARQWP